MTDLNQIAKSLSDAQREAIVDGLARYMDPNTTKALRKKGLCERRGSMLTMLGLQVRAHLLAAEFTNAHLANAIREGENGLVSISQALRAITAALSASDGEKYRLMLLDLLAVIHRDGGHKTQEIGIKLAYEQALQLSSERIAALDELRRLSTPFAESAKSPSDSVREALDVLRRQLPDLDAAAAPTKCETYVICGAHARAVHSAIETVAAALQSSEAANG